MVINISDKDGKPVRKPLIVIKTALIIEVYNLVYGIADLENIINLFNNIHNPQAVVRLGKIETENMENVED